VDAAWKIRRRQGACSACGRGFAEGEELFSLLRLEEEELQRADLCGGCFDDRDPGQDLLYWRTRHQQRRGALKVDFEMLLAALEELQGDERDEIRDFCFLVALLLVRHRRLRLLQIRRRGAREMLLLRRPRSRREVEVEVRDLDEATRSRLAGILNQLLDPTREGGLADLLGSGVPGEAPEEA